METIAVRVLIDESGDAPFEEWYDAISDKTVRQAIASRIRRLREGNFGDHHSVGGGVSELRIHLGPGYRIYYGRVGSTLVILLGGGTKRRQENDIKEAISLWEEYRDEIKRRSRDV